MRKQDALALACCGAIAAFALVYHLNPPGPVYLPLRREWALQKPPGEVAMAWYARLVYSSVAGLLVFGVLRALLGFHATERPLPAPMVWGTTLAVFLLWLFVALTMIRTELAHL